MKSFKDHITLFVLLLVYAVFGLRYIPGDWGRTAAETLLHLANVLPLSIGSTIENQVSPYLLFSVFSYAII